MKGMLSIYRFDIDLADFLSSAISCCDDVAASPDFGDAFLHSIPNSI